MQARIVHVERPIGCMGEHNSLPSVDSVANGGADNDVVSCHLFFVCFFVFSLSFQFMICVLITFHALCLTFLFVSSLLSSLVCCNLPPHASPPLVSGLARINPDLCPGRIQSACNRFLRVNPINFQCSGGFVAASFRHAAKTGARSVPSEVLVFPTHWRTFPSGSRRIGIDVTSTGSWNERSGTASFYWCPRRLSRRH